MGATPSRREFHTSTPNERINNIDSDDGNSWLCSACTLPIFTTPFISHQTDYIHQQCSNGPPDELIGHALHPRGTLILKDNYNSSTTNNSCDNCNRKCGSKFYECSDGRCCFRLDLLCALQIKISHRSHHHELMVLVNSGSSIISCGACGTQHLGSAPSPLSYLCSLCGFWLHPECASLPNAITLLPGHHHSLFLTYHLLRPDYKYFPERAKNFPCGICGEVVHNGGVYICAECHYYAHIKCATSDPTCFKPVLIRDAKFAGLLHFPLANERTNVVRLIMESNPSSDHGKLLQETPHQHPLIFHDKDDQTIDEDGDDDDEKYSSRVCNACVKRIDSPPFYSCSHCPDFLLHSFCANLPSKIDHPMHPEHPLFLFPKAPSSDICSYYRCRGCWFGCNGFAYSCNTCYNFSMDVVCALLPPAITHESHNKTHILYMSPKTGKYKECNSCCTSHVQGIYYSCNTCREFTLDAECVVLPNTVHHKFDEHPLTLTTTHISEKICEICEGRIIHPGWHYSCSQCEQSFHCRCIVAYRSRIKLGSSIRVNTHGCPLKLVLERMVSGYRCGFCRKVFSHDSTDAYYINQPAYECSKCYYRIHKECAKQCLSVSE